MVHFSCSILLLCWSSLSICCEKRAALSASFPLAMFTEAETTITRHAEPRHYRATGEQSGLESELDDDGGFQGAVDMIEALLESRRWIEAVTECVFAKEDFVASLEDGILLCKLLRKLTKRNLGKLNRAEKPSAYMENIKLFLKECKKFGLHRSQLFTLDDFQFLVGKETNALLLLTTGKQKLRNLLVTIYWLGRRVQSSSNYRFTTLDLAVFSQIVVPGSTELTPPAKKGMKFNFLGHERSRSTTPDRKHHITITKEFRDEPKEGLTRTSGSVLEKQRQYEQHGGKNEKTRSGSSLGKKSLLPLTVTGTGSVSDRSEASNRGKVIFSTDRSKEKNKSIPKAFVPPYNSRENIVVSRNESKRASVEAKTYNPTSFAFSDDEAIIRRKHTVPVRYCYSSGVDSEQDSPTRGRIGSVPNSKSYGKGSSEKAIPENAVVAPNTKVKDHELKSTDGVSKTKASYGVAPAVQKVTITSTTNGHLQNGGKHVINGPTVIDHRRPSASNDSDAGYKSETGRRTTVDGMLRDDRHQLTTQKSDLSALVRASMPHHDNGEDHDAEDDFHSISVYRDYVRQRFAERQSSIDKGDMMLRDLLSAGHVDMAKALGLSQELVELVREEEKFWSRQVKLRSWRESQEKRVHDNDEKERRIALLRQERDEQRAKENRRRSREIAAPPPTRKKLTVEEMLCVEEEFLAQQAERMMWKDNKRPQRSILKQSKSFDKPIERSQRDKVTRRSEPPPVRAERGSSNRSDRHSSSGKEHGSSRDSTLEEPIHPARHALPLSEICLPSDSDDVFASASRKSPAPIRQDAVDGSFDDDDSKRVSFEQDELYDACAVPLGDGKHPKCHDCGHRIRDAKLIALQTRTSRWHLVCFVCVVCRANLGFIALDRGVPVRIMDSRVHCRNCYSLNGNQLTEV